MPNLSGLREENFDNISIQGVDVTTDVFSTTKNGLVPASGTSNTTDFLRRDGTFSTVPSPAVGDGGLTEKNFTTDLKNKLDGIDSNANNYTLPSTVQFQPSEGAFGDGDKTKLDAIPSIPAPSASDATKVITVNSTGNYILDEGATSTYDSVVPNGTITATNIGGLSSGTDVSNLKGNSIISVLDTILFPVVNPTRTDGYISINNNFKDNDVFYVGNTQSGTVSFTPNYGSYEKFGSINDGENYYGAIEDTEFIMTTGAYYDISNSSSEPQVVQTLSFTDGTTGINSIGSGTSTTKYLNQLYPPPPYNSSTQKYTSAYNSISLHCKATFGEGTYTPKNSHGNDYTQTNPAMPANETLKQDTNTRYSVYQARQEAGDGTTELNPNKPSRFLSTHSNEGFGLIFSFDFDETSSLKHRMLIPASFHDTLSAGKSWTIMEQVGTTAYTTLDSLAGFTSSTTGEAIGSSSDWSLTTTIDHVKYYILKHIDEVSVALGQLTEKNYKLRREN